MRKQLEKNLRVFGLYLIFTCVFCFELSAQNASEVRIVSSSSLSFETVNGEAIQKIINAVVSADNFKIIADSAVKFVNKNEFRAFGDIQIETNDRTIWADTLYYYTDTDFSRLRGRVILATDTSTIYSHSVDYLFSFELARFLDYVRLEDKNGLLQARGGEYFQKQDSAVFRNQVQLQDSTQYAEGDSLLINRSSQAFRFFGNVFAVDSLNNTLLESDFMSGDSTGNRSLIGNAYLRSISADTSDTTHINAEEIYVRKQEGNRFTEAREDVRIWSRQFSAIADSTVFDENEELFELYKSPIAWHENIQLTGPYIRVQVDSSKIESLLSFPDPFTASEDSLTGRINQITGDTLLADFQEGTISQIKVYPNSFVLFHSVNEDDEADGAIEFNALEETTMFFSSGRIDSVLSVKSIDGIYIPEIPELSDRKLDGFSWSPELKPLRPLSIPVMKLPPINEDLPFSLPRRYLEFVKKQN